MELAQLSRVDRRRRVAHQIDGLRRLWERDYLADRRLTRQEGANAIEAERESAVRRRAVLERLEEESEAVLRVLVREPEQAEHLGLRLAVMNTNAAAAELPAVEDHIVGLRHHLARLRFKHVQIFFTRRGERVVHRVPALLVGVPVEQREVGDPGQLPLAFRNQVLSLRDLQAKLAEDLGCRVRRAGSEHEQIFLVRA